MKLRYTRSGGLAAISTQVELDSAKLPAKKAETVSQLISASASATTRKRKPSGHPDEITHSLQVEVGARRYRISCKDSECTPELVELFDYLQQKALAAMKKNQ